MKWSGKPDLDALNGRTGRLYDSDGNKVKFVALAALVIAALVMVGW